jgi:formylglycine-generating enzyme required for sulfatase activity
VAFCQWLSERLGYQIRLPTEFEWQCAATGGNAENVYPWGSFGPKEEPWRANTFESGLGRSTAVGMYPAGASAADVFDMTGTIWEWCLNSFDDPRQNGFPVSKDDRRTIRGGSFYGSETYGRCKCRDWFYWLERGRHIGFRVMCSSPVPNR